MKLMLHYRSDDCFFRRVTMKTSNVGGRILPTLLISCSRVLAVYYYDEQQPCGSWIMLWERDRENVVVVTDAFYSF